MSDGSLVASPVEEMLRDNDRRLLVAWVPLGEDPATLGTLIRGPSLGLVHVYEGGWGWSAVGEPCTLDEGWHQIARWRGCKPSHEWLLAWACSRWPAEADA